MGNVDASSHGMVKRFGKWFLLLDIYVPASLSHAWPVASSLHAWPVEFPGRAFTTPR